MPTAATKQAPAAKKVKRSAAVKKAAPAKPRNATSSAAAEALARPPIGGSDRSAQLRLRDDEALWLAHSMQVLHLETKSDALREALRLLHRYATEVEAEEEIRNFYNGKLAPLPVGVVPFNEQEAAEAAADSK
jgi:hypothetical protein